MGPYRVGGGHVRHLRPNLITWRDEQTPPLPDGCIGRWAGRKIEEIGVSSPREAGSQRRVKAPGISRVEIVNRRAVRQRTMWLTES